MNFNLVGFAVIQIPEMALCWYGQVKNRWLNMKKSESHSFVETEPAMTNSSNIIKLQNRRFQSKGKSIIFGNQPTQQIKTEEKERAIETPSKLCNEQWIVISARMNNVELKLQQLTDVIEKITKVH